MSSSIHRRFRARKRTLGVNRELSIKDGEDALKIRQHVVVPKPQDAKIVLCEPAIANFIADGLRVLTTIYFNGEARRVARHDIHFKIELVALLQRAEGRNLQCVRNDQRRESVLFDVVDGERDAVERDRAFRRDEARQILRHT